MILYRYIYSILYPMKVINEKEVQIDTINFGTFYKEYTNIPSKQQNIYKNWQDNIGKNPKNDYINLIAPRDEFEISYYLTCNKSMDFNDYINTIPDYSHKYIYVLYGLKSTNEYHNISHTISKCIYQNYPIYINILITPINIIPYYNNKTYNDDIKLLKAYKSIQIDTKDIIKKNSYLLSIDILMHYNKEAIIHTDSISKDIVKQFYLLPQQVYIPPFIVKASFNLVPNNNNNDNNFMVSYNYKTTLKFDNIDTYTYINYLMSDIYNMLPQTIYLYLILFIIQIPIFFRDIITITPSIYSLTIDLFIGILLVLCSFIESKEYYIPLIRFTACNTIVIPSFRILQKYIFNNSIYIILILFTIFSYISYYISTSSDIYIVYFVHDNILVVLQTLQIIRYSIYYLPYFSSYTKFLNEPTENLSSIFYIFLQLFSNFYLLLVSRFMYFSIISIVFYTILILHPPKVIE